ncbi:AraC family transcriptional regulator N-terminal domain-containing protein [Maricaulis sp.]|uniref:AraC family transcriptional regulator n=1 Tax=Maricaulis sp. TaxID=1486257 RepID=UPI003A8C986C
MAHLEQLRRDMIDYANNCGFDDWPQPTHVPTLSLVRSRVPTQFTAVDYQPLFCLVLQGSKQTLIGESLHRFGALQSLIVSLDLPATACVVEATAQTPYLALALDLDIGLLRDLASELDDLAGMDSPPSRTALVVGDADPALIDAMARLFALRGSAMDIEVLAPLVIREIHYRLLLGNQGAALRALMQPDGQASRIARAITRIRRDYTAPLTIAGLAREAGMSISAFHDHFRALTGTTPLQYQKALRLMEARRRLQGTAASVTAIAFEVGYESPTQFSREYRRKFGQSPREDRPVTA